MNKFRQRLDEGRREETRRELHCTRPWAMESPELDDPEQYYTATRIENTLTEKHERPNSVLSGNGEKHEDIWGDR
jgi:hypothetical protein